MPRTTGFEQRTGKPESPWRALKVRLLLFAQRNSRAVPEVFRRRLGRLLGPALREPSLTVEDWSQSLVGGPEPCLLHSFEGDRSEERKRTAKFSEKPASKVRCALATASLDAGGMDEVVAFLARGLPRFGISVAVLHTSNDGLTSWGRLARRLEEEPGIEVLSLDRESCPSWFRQHRPDVLSVHGAPDWVLEAAASCSVPVIETLHGMHDQFSATRSEITTRRHLLDGMISVSEMVRQQYLDKDSGCSPGFIVTIPNGLLTRRNLTLSRAEARKLLGLSDEYLFVALARHCVQKNTYGLARAFSRVGGHAGKAHLLVSGRPDDAAYVGQVMQLKGRMPHGDRLHVRDHIRYPEVILSAADSFVLDSFFEGWALASMEALVAGKPVVLSDVGGAREQLAEHPEWGLLVPNPLGDPLKVNWETISEARFQPQHNEEELVAAMLAMTRDDIWNVRSEQFAADAQERFDGLVCLEKHANVLRSAAAGEPIAQP